MSLHFNRHALSVFSVARDAPEIVLTYKRRAFFSIFRQLILVENGGTTMNANMYRIALFAIAITAFFPSSQPLIGAEQEGLGRQLFNDGFSAMTAGDWDRCIQKFTDGLKLDPSNLPPHYHLGMCLQARGYPSDIEAAKIQFGIASADMGAVGADARAALDRLRPRLRKPLGESNNDQAPVTITCKFTQHLELHISPEEEDKSLQETGSFSFTLNLSTKQVQLKHAHFDGANKSSTNTFDILEMNVSEKSILFKMQWGYTTADYLDWMEFPDIIIDRETHNLSGTSNPLGTMRNDQIDGNCSG